ncbi:MAG: radical SAM protein [Alistipes sp.]|jgi:wyosine [tRNA(Phe)-imidazoG37] synthetase (radical SAM superfamily)|nr:radical SAM protein [Alistipes sp.]
MTALFDDVIFGPVRSRRLGLSLGVNLLPLKSKLCNFDCIYCECGWNGHSQTHVTSLDSSCAASGDCRVSVGELAPVGARFNSREDVARLLGEKLRRMAAAGECPDVITFAGNGEPTIHPDFEAIIDDTLRLRDEICPSAKVSVLSNATMIGRPGVRRALERVDNNILKLDSAFDDTVRLVNDPQGAYSVAATVEGIKSFGGREIVQTMFLRGELGGHGGQTIDNTTEREVSAWLALIADIKPRQVMIYTIDRDTPAEGLQKVPVNELRAIATRVEALGIPVSVAG